MRTAMCFVAFATFVIFDDLISSFSTALLFTASYVLDCT